MSMRKFSDFATNDARLDGEKMNIADILDRPIIVKAFKIISSCVPGKKCLDLQFEYNDKLHVLFTNSEVLMRQLTEYKEHLPFETVIKRIHRYYTFT